MAQETLVAVFDTLDDADAAVVALVGSGVRVEDIERHAAACLAASTDQPGGAFWTTLFGGETTREQDAVYDRTVRAGGDVVTVLLDDGDRDAGPVMTVLERYRPVDVAERAASGTSEQILQLSEERLTVGKRAVSRGAIRLRRLVRSEAVERRVSLRDQRVSVERRAVAPDTAVGADAFVDRVIEMAETDEELVVSKVARVREEVLIHTQVTERVETVRENLRREEVEIDHLDAPPRAPGA